MQERLKKKKGAFLAFCRASNRNKEGTKLRLSSKFANIVCLLATPQLSLFSFYHFIDEFCCQLLPEHTGLIHKMLIHTHNIFQTIPNFYCTTNLTRPDDDDDDDDACIYLSGDEKKEQHSHGSTGLYRQRNKH